MEERRRALEVNGHGRHAPPVSVCRGSTSERFPRAVGPGVSERSPARSLAASRTDAPLRETRAVCRIGEPDGAFVVDGRSLVGSRSVGSSRRTSRRRRYAEGPTKVAGGAGRRAAEGAPARAGYRAGTPLHRPPPSRGAEVETRTASSLQGGPGIAPFLRAHRRAHRRAPARAVSPGAGTSGLSGRRVDRSLRTGHPRGRRGPPDRRTTATPSVPAETVVAIRRAAASWPSVLGAA
jgi:hypothetical protein